MNNSGIRNKVLQLSMALFLISACSQSAPIKVELGKTWTNYRSQFKVISAQRYSQSHTDGDYTYYDEVVLVVLEWKCLKGNAGNECTVGGYQFSLLGENNHRSFDSVTFPDEVMKRFGITLPSDVLNCCGMIRYPQTLRVHLLFSVDCTSHLVLKFPDYSGESEAGVIYNIDLPESAQCTR